MNGRAIFIHTNQTGPMIYSFATQYHIISFKCISPSPNTNSRVAISVSKPPRKISSYYFYRYFQKCH